jgi:hypothetical protein
LLLPKCCYQIIIHLGLKFFFLCAFYAGSGLIVPFDGGFWEEEGDGFRDECLFGVLLDFLAYVYVIGMQHHPPPQYLLLYHHHLSLHYS